MKVNFVYQLTGILDAGLTQLTSLYFWIQQVKIIGKQYNYEIEPSNQVHQSEPNHGIGEANQICGFFAMNLSSKR